MTRRPTNDTHPDIEALRIERFRQMTTAEKLAQMEAMTAAVLELACLDVRRRHPGADEREVQLRVASRWLDPDVLKTAFGWDVSVKGY
jgi:hypothetical protein